MCIRDSSVCRGANVGSQHYLLVGKIGIKLKRKVKKKPVRAYAAENLKECATAEGFGLELSNRFKTLQPDLSTEEQ